MDAPRGHGEALSRQQETAIAALLSERTAGKAARKAGVDAKTLRRWLRDPDFLREYRAARQQVVEAAVGRLQQGLGEAVDALRRNLKDPAPPAVQVRAAEALLGHGLKALETFDVIERLEALEQRTGGKGGG